MSKRSKGNRDGFAGFEEAFEAENRKSKLVVILCAIALACAITIAFGKTLYHLGSLNAYVPGVFEDDDERPKLRRHNTEYPRIDR